MAGLVELKNILNEIEYSALNDQIIEKIEHQLSLLNTRIEESDAKYERLKVNSEQQYIEIESQLINSNAKLETESSEKVEFKAKVDDLAKKYEEASTKLRNIQTQDEGNLTTQLKLLKANEQLENEKREFALLVEKRDIEVNSMNEELKEMSRKLSQVNKEKCEVSAQLDEMRSLDVSKEFQRKRLEHEKENLQIQIDSLNNEVDEKMKQIMDTRREKSNSIMEMRSDLDKKTDECNLLNATVESLRKNSLEQQTKIDSLIQRIKDIQDSNLQSEERFRQEIQARIRLVELYKGAALESENKSTELTDTVTELQRLVKEGAEANTTIENEKNQEIQELKDELESKEESVRNLKQELVNANNLIESVKSTGMNEEKLETLFPTAAATSRLLKSGMSLTEIYNEYVKASDALHLEKQENQRLNTYLDQILREIEEKAPLLKKQREDYEESLKGIDQMTRQLDAALLERQNLRAETDESHRKSNHLSKENLKQRQQIMDLSDQVKYLVKEIEELRGGRIVREKDISSPEVSSSSRVISEKLVTFGNIEELQEQNLKLLTVIRELSEKQELEDNINVDSKTKELHDELKLRQQELETLKDIRQKETDLLDSVVRQRDMYRALLQQTTSTPELTSTPAIQSMSPVLSNAGGKSPEKDKSSDETSKTLKQLQETFTTYKTEKSENDKIMNEQMEKLRKEASDLRIQNAKLASQLEYSSEKYKVLQGNAESYKKGMAVKTETIQKYSTTVAKHEATLSALREDLLAKQEQLSQAQARMDNMGREKEIVKASEQRLAAEVESLRREIRSQSQLMGNLQAVQINLERSEQDVKFKLGKQIETLEREKSIIKKKLETEEKQQEVAAKHFEKQIQELRDMLESEMSNHQSIKDRYTEMVKESETLKQQLDLVSQKVQVAESKQSDRSTDDLVSETSSEIRDLRSQLEQQKFEIQNLQSQLEIGKQHVEQYKTIANSVQQSLQEQKEMNSNFKETMDEKVKEAELENNNLKEQLERVEKEREDLLSEKTKMSEEKDNINTDLKQQLESVQAELQEAIAKGENAESLKEDAQRDAQKQAEEAQEARDKYEKILMKQAEDMEDMTAVKEKLAGFDVLMAAKEEEVMKLIQQIAQNKASFEEREAVLNAEKERLGAKIETLDQDNKKLHDQIIKFSVQVVSEHEKVVESSILKASEAHQSSSAGTSDQEDVKSSAQLLEVIRYLKREKEIAEGRLDVVETESCRMTQKCKSLEKQLETLNAQMAEEKQQLQAEMKTPSQHAELMYKVESHNILLESNRMLRENKNQLQSQLSQAENKLKTLEEKIKPLEEELKSVQVDKETADNDCKAAFAEVEVWKARTNQLIEQLHKTDPEEHKRLLQERIENRKKISSLTDELQQARNEVSKSSQECSRLQNEIKNEISKSGQECSKLQSLIDKEKGESKKLSEEVTKLKETVEEKDKDIEEKAKTMTQLRKIGRKYKDQAEIVTKEFEEYKTQVDSENLQSVKEANEEKIKQLEDNLKEEQSANESKEAKVKELEEKIKELDEKNDQMDKNAKDLDAKRATLETSLKESEMKRADLEQKVVASRTEKETVREQLKEQREQLKEQNSKLKEENTELEKKVTRFSNILQNAKSKIQAFKETNEKLTAERTENNKKLAEMTKKLSAYEQTSAEESDLKIASMKSLFENQIHKLEEELTSAKKENTELQTKIQQLQKQVEDLQKQGSTSVTAHTARTVSSVSVDRTSSSPSEPPKTANIRPIASSPATIKPQTVPVQPQSAASRVTASIRPMAIAPTSVPSMTSGTPTATVMPTTVTPLEVPAEGESLTPVQQLFPQPGGSGTRPIQQVIPTQENQSSSQEMTGSSEMGFISVEPQQSSSRDTSITSVSQTNKRQREDLESPGSSDDVLQKRQKISTTEETQEIPEITVTDENATTTQVDTQPDIERHTEMDDTTHDQPRSIENIFDMESQDDGVEDTTQESEQGQVEVVEEGEGAGNEEEEEVEEEEENEEEAVIIVESDEGQEEEEEYEEVEEEGGDEEGDEEGEEQYEGDDVEEHDEETDRQADEVIDIYSDIGVIQESGSQSNQPGTREHDTEEVVIIDEGDEEDAQAPDSMPSSQPSSQSSSQTLLPPLQPLLAPERQLSVGTRSQLTPFMIGANPYEDLDDCTVPSTPTLNVPRRGDGFAEAVSSPQVSQRFVFGSGGEHNLPGFPQLDTQTGMGMDDTRMDLTQLEDTSGRSVPSTPLHSTAPVTVITEAVDTLSGQSELNVVSQSDIDINVEEETEEVQLEEMGGEEEEVLEGDQGEEDVNEGESESDKEQAGSSETVEAGTSQEDLSNMDKSQDANKPKIQKIVWEKAPTAPPSNPPMVGQAIQSLSQPVQYMGRPNRGAQRGGPTARRSFLRGQTRRPMRGRGNFMRRPHMY